MEACPAPHTLRAPSAEEAAALRGAFAAHGYSDERLIARLGGIELPTRRTGTLPRLMRQTAGGAPLDTLARLFLFGAAVPAAAARAALEPVPLELLCRLGLATFRGADIAASVVLFPYGKFLLAFDLPELFVSGAARDVVMGISASTMDLAHATIRKPVRNTLDLGCGCGLQAFLAAAHSERVVALDLSPRAAAFARFNVALNGTGNIDCLEGDRFEPVRGRRFDLITSNLPFVVAPASDYLYRDGGMPLDSFARGVIREAPAYLEEGGFCHILCEWVHTAGEDWRERLGEWFDGTGCDVAVVKLSTAPAFRYAELWIRETEPDDSVLYAAKFEQWADYYERNGIEAISTGLVTMRRSSGGRNWLHIGERPGRIPAGFGEQVLRSFALHDLLNGAGAGERLLDIRLGVGSDVRLTTENEWTPGGWHVVEARLGRSGLSGVDGAVNANVVNLLSLLDGARTLRDAIAMLAVRIGAPFDRVAAGCLPLVRELIADGFLRPAEHED